MKIRLLGLVMISAIMQTTGVLAEPGVWWEASTKMEMEGMPFAMPAQTMEVCIPKGKEGDPSYTQSKDEKCKMTDVKKSGNKVTFKGSCVRDGETMNMSGETVVDANSYKTNMTMSGTSRGETMKMSMVSTGRSKGEVCDTSQKDRKLQAQFDQRQATNDSSCEDKLAKGGLAVVGSSEDFIGNNPFAGKNAPSGSVSFRFGCFHKKAEFCSVIKRDLPNDEKIYHKLQERDKSAEQGGIASVSKACNIDMESAPKFYCKQKATTGPIKYLMKYCPAEAKAYREVLRARCGEYQFSGQKVALSASQMEQCMNEEKVSDDEYVLKESGKVVKKSDEPQSDAPSDAIRQGTRALKGMFGF